MVTKQRERGLIQPQIPGLPHRGFLGHIPKKLPALEFSSDSPSREPKPSHCCTYILGLLWGFREYVWSIEQCLLVRTTYSSSSNTSLSVWSLRLCSCCSLCLLCLSFPLHLAHTKMSFWIRLRNHFFLEAFPDHLLHLARSGIPPLCFYRLSSSVTAWQRDENFEPCFVLFLCVMIMMI